MIAIAASIWLVAVAGWAFALIERIRRCAVQDDLIAERCRTEALATENNILKQQRDGLFSKGFGRAK